MSEITEIPIKALGREAKGILSSLLNPVKIFPTDENLPRDWRGLAELCNIGGEHISSIQRCEDPVRKILQMWSDKAGNESTIEKLLSFLEKLDRYDVLDDITPCVEKDIEYFKSNPKAICVDPIDSDDEEILTYDDAKRKLQRKPLRIYDAFVLFDDEDINFATTIVQTLEGTYGMKLCVKDRDVVGGKLEDTSIISKILNRCRKIIVVSSPYFWNSLTNRCLYRMVHLDTLEKKRSRFLPCAETKEGRDLLPIEFRLYHTLILQNSFGTFWYQLSQSIGEPMATKEQRALPERSTEKPANSVNHVKFETEKTKEEELPTPKENNIPAQLISEDKPTSPVPQGVKIKNFVSKFLPKGITSKKQKKEKRKVKMLAS